MKAWAYGLILLSLFGMIIKGVLPKGERSGLFPPLKFLLALVLIVAVISPVFSLLRGKGPLSEISSLWEGSSETVEGDTLILNRLAQVMGEEVTRAFPESVFSFEIYTDENKVPVKIRVVSEDREDARKIADFVKIKYGIETCIQTKEDS